MACAAHAYCPACGQENKRHDVSLGEVLREAWDEIAKVDSKLLKTAVPLLFRPGFLTREFIAGKRVRYISPFKMYLIVSFFFFVALGWKAQDGIARNLARGQTTLAKETHRAREEKAAAEARRKAKKNATTAAPPRPPQVTGGQTKEKHGPFTVLVGDSRVGLADLPDSVASYRAAQAKLPAAKRDEWRTQFGKHLLILFKSGNTASLVGGLFDAGSKMMFFLLPVYALLLKVLYIRSRRLYVEHFVYALHVHTVFFLFLTLELLVPIAGLRMVLAAAFLLYSFLSLRTVYGQGVIKTLFKSWLLGSAYFFVSVVALVVTLLVSLAVQSGFLAAAR